MEDWQEQEYEFWRRLDEERVSRGTLLRRGLAAGAGLTIIASPAAALAARRRVLKEPPLRGRDISLAEIVAEAKKENHLNTIALPPDWANYGEILSTFQKKYKIPITNASPEASSGDEVQAIKSLKGQSRAPDVVDVGPSFAVSGANEGLYAKYYVTNFKTIPRAMKDGRGFWTGDYWGVIGFGANLNVVNRVPTDWNDLMSPDFKNKVALNDDPRKANAAFSGVFAAALANGGSLSDIRPGIDFFAKLKKIGNFVPINVTGQTVASGQTPVTIDLDYLQFGYTKTYVNIKWKVGVPKTGVYGGYYCQAINATAPHPWSARLWEEFLYSDQGQLLWLKGYSHPARFQDLAKRKRIPAALLKALPSPKLYAKVKFATSTQQTAAKAKIAAEWPTI